MENVVALVSSSAASSTSPFLVGAPNPSAIPATRRRPSPLHPSLPFRRGEEAAAPPPPLLGGERVLERLKIQGFASISSSSGSEVTTASGTAPPVPPPPSYIGSPLFWIGVGVGLSALFSMVVTRVKRYAMQQAFKTMMNQAAPQSGQFNNPMFPGGLPFPFPAATQAAPTSVLSPSLQTQNTSQPPVTVEVPASRVEAAPSSEVIEETKTTEEAKKFAFVDVSPEELMQKEHKYSEESVQENTVTVEYEKKVSTNGAASKPDSASSEQSQSRKSPPFLSVDALEKMMEDPTVQKMVYPYLPEEMRNPTTFKWMLENPQYRQQLQDMLNNMGGSTEWDSRMMDSLKNFDLSSPEVKQQFDQIGLTPEEVISKIMANPEVATAFQNPKVQAAIMDCSQNPLNIAKYQNDKEVMDVFTKISELFPGVTGYP
uniref:Protein TIC 40, chloroplastic n=1 Tax=Ananas comosus var. bracteatus TaxID=296719 RepID=A0A6V7Q1Y9_ANACO|nr:unnamed protein product [Ananas comosus var. bracteatus]